jgi:phage minor structural protein, N-terminal domain protein|nr:MAG TPA: minor structural protein [Caudoviricetes sp.]
MIYLFDKDEKLIKIVKKEAIKTALQKFALTTEKYVSDRLTVEMKTLSKKEFDAVEYMAIQSIEDAHTFHYFYIAQKFSENLTTLIGVQSGIEELRKSVVLDKRPHNTFARPVIDELLAGTNWQARFVSETSQRSTNFYYISTFEALKKVCQVWNLEMQFFVEVNGNKIGARYIDFKQKIGEATGKRVVYGHNALQILQEVERTNLFTALIGRGKGEELSAPSEENNHGTYGRRITFEDVVWETKKGNPVDKPKGQKYVELPEMTKLYGIKNADGSMRAKVGFAVFEDEEDKNALIKRTYDELVRASRPQLTLKTSTVYLKGVKIGDTIRVVRHDKKLDYDTRIFEITFNRLNNESSDIKLGDRISESNEAKIQNIASQKADELISSSFNGLLKNLPDFLPSADGLNKNWYGTNDPTKAHAGKVGVNDIWFKPNPEHEGQTIMLRWTGEVWKEIIRSNSDQEIIDEISKRFENLNLSGVDEIKAKAEEALKKAGTSAELANEARNRALDSIRDLNAFKTSVQEERENLSDELKRYSREETKSWITSLRESFTNRFVAKSTYFENVEGINRRFEALTSDNEAKFAEYKQSVSERIANLSSQMADKANVVDFQRVRETSQLYERILGNTDNGIADNVARMALTNQLFQVEIAKNVGDSRNYVRNADFREGSKNWRESNVAGLNFNYKHSMLNRKKPGVHIFGSSINGLYPKLQQTFKIVLKKSDKISLSFLVSKDGENTFSGLDIGLHYRKDGAIKSQKWRNVQNNEIPGGVYKKITLNFELPIDIDEINLMLYGEQGKSINLYISEVKLETGSQATSFTLAPEDTEEAVKTVQTQLAGSYAIQNLNSAGDVLGAINLNPDGSVKINEGLISVGEKTYIKDGVIKKSMIGNAQIGTAHIGEIDASQARIINISAKNIVAEGLTANVIKGGKLTSLNNVTDFDLQTGWIDMNGFGVGIKNQFPNRPLQYLVFGAGNINGVDASYTALLSNRNGLQQMDHTSAGLQIWNGRSRTGNSIQSAINMYGRRITFNQSAQGGLRELAIETDTNTITGVDEILIQGVRLSYILNDIYDNFRNLDHDGNYRRGYYSKWK